MSFSILWLRGCGLTSARSAVSRWVGSSSGDPASGAVASTAGSRAAEPRLFGAVPSAATATH